MATAQVTLNVRKVNDATSVVDIRGEVTAAAENALTDAYTQASGNSTRAIVLNFSGLEYMNSSGIGLLVTMLIRANRQKQKLYAFGLNDHYKQIFTLTRLNEAIKIFESEKDALAAA
jgi:anti-sigma B factor antagonist